MSQLLESTGKGIFGTDLQGCCTFVNRAGAQQLGLAPADVLGLNTHELAHHTHADGTHYPEHLRPIFNAFRQGLSCRVDTKYFWRVDGTPFPVAYSAYPIVEAGLVQGAVVTFVDIYAWRLAHAVLEQRVDERTRIAREVHHELGSLLVVLKMDIGWLDKRLSQQQQRKPEAAHAMQNTMRGKCQSMSRQIKTAFDNVGRIIKPTCAQAFWTIRACGPHWTGKRTILCSRPNWHSTGA